MQHLNLQNTGLNQPALMKIMLTVSRSKTLHAVHLCNNPGLYYEEVVTEAKKVFNPLNFEDWTKPKNKSVMIDCQTSMYSITESSESFDDQDPKTCKSMNVSHIRLQSDDDKDSVNSYAPLNHKDVK